MPKKVRPIPQGYHTLTPSLNQADAAQTIAFCKKAFGATLLSKVMAPNDKIMHAELQIGDSRMMLSDAVHQPPQASSLFLYVLDVDKTFAKAVKAGATVVMPVTDMFWGDRFGAVKDAQGNSWAIATHTEDVPPAETKKRAKAFYKNAG